MYSSVSHSADMHAGQCRYRSAPVEEEVDADFRTAAMIAVAGEGNGAGVVRIA